MQAEAKGDVLGSDQLQSALKLVERMGVQNQSVDVIMDFKVNANAGILVLCFLAICVSQVWLLIGSKTSLLALK